MSRDWTNLLWREKTWGERAQTVVANVAAGIVGLAMFAVALLVIDQALDGVSRYNSDHRRCLQKATNGLEFHLCR